MSKTSSSKYILGQIKVKLLEESERGRFDELLERLHYLKSARIGGRSLRNGNLTLGLFGRQKNGTGSFPSWRRKMTPSKAIRILSSKKWTTAT